MLDRKSGNNACRMPDIESRLFAIQDFLLSVFLSFKFLCWFYFYFREEEACSVLYEFPWQFWLWISLYRGCARTYSRVQSRFLFFCLISFTREICFISFFLFNFFYTWDLLYLFLSLQFLLLMRSALSLSFSLISFTHEICFISFFHF
jgi:hypothetical protein